MVYLELFVIFILILLNGLFSFSKTALLSSRKIRLITASKSGQSGSQSALDLVENPDSFSSAVQISTTLICIVIGFYSCTSLSHELIVFLSSIHMIVPYVHIISPVIIFIVTAYLLIVFGFLIPQKIAQSNPEKYAVWISKPIHLLSKILYPFTFLILGSSHLFMKIFGIKSSEINTTEEDVKAVVQEGLEDGVIDEAEQDLVERIFSLDDRKIGSLITHKNDIIWVDVSTTHQELLEIVNKEPYSVYPVVDKDIDHIVGIIRLKDLVGRVALPSFKLANFIRPANFLPENMSILSVLENFKSAKIQYALITDEFGSIQGIVTISDVFEALVGDVSANPSHEEYEITPRSDNSWLVDGQYPFYDFLEYFNLQDYYNEYPYNTLSGLILEKLEKMPRAGDKFDWFHFEIEVVDMDFARIDKVMVTDISVSDTYLE